MAINTLGSDLFGGGNSPSANPFSNFLGNNYFPKAGFSLGDFENFLGNLMGQYAQGALPLQTKSLSMLNSILGGGGIPDEFKALLAPQYAQNAQGFNTANRQIRDTTQGGTQQQALGQNASGLAQANANSFQQLYGPLIQQAFSTGLGAENQLAGQAIGGAGVRAQAKAGKGGGMS